MRYYEIVLMLHLDQGERISDIISKYTQIIKDSGGNVHRLEDWGRKQLSYPIKKVHKAHYYLMNIEATTSVMHKLNESFQFNNAVLRKMIIRKKKAITEASIMYKNKEEKTFSEES